MYLAGLEHNMSASPLVVSAYKSRLRLKRINPITLALETNPRTSNVRMADLDRALAEAEAEDLGGLLGPTTVMGGQEVPSSCNVQ